MSNTLEEATELVENLVASNVNHYLDYDRKPRRLQVVRQLMS